MSRIEGGALRPQSDWYDLGELAREVIARLRPSLQGREVRLELPIKELSPIEIDYLMIDQVLTNLIENAAKYTPAGRPIEVRIEADPGTLTMRTRVVDHGPGIPPADVRPRLRQVLPGQPARPDLWLRTGPGGLQGAGRGAPRADLDRRNTGRRGDVLLRATGQVRHHRCWKRPSPAEVTA